MKKTIFSLLVANFLTLGVSNATEDKDATFTVSLSKSQPSCGLTVEDNIAFVSRPINFTVNGPGNGMHPFVYISAWVPADENGLTNKNTYLKNISQTIPRPVYMSKDQTEKKDSFQLMKRDDVVFNENTTGADLTLTLICYESDEMAIYQDRMIAFQNNDFMEIDH